MTELESPFEAHVLIVFLNEERWMAYEFIRVLKRMEPTGWADAETDRPTV